MPDKKSDRPIAKPRKGADEARRGEHTADLLNALRHFAAIADSRGRLQFADEAAPRALGYEPADILRKPFWEASWFGPSPQSQHAIKEGLREAIAGESVHCQVEAFTKKGTPVPVTFNITSLKGAEGSIVSIVAQVEPLDEDKSDIEGPLQQQGKLNSSTDQKKAEAALREADKRYHALFDNPLNIVFVNDGRGTILDANDAALSRFGFSRETLGTLGFQDILHPEDFPAAAQALAQVMAEGCLEEPIQVRALSKSGEMIWIEVCGFPIEQDEHGYRGLAVARDITDRKKAEEALRQSEERYRLVADNATDTVWTTDMNLKFTFLSSGRVHSLGYTDEEIKNMRIDQLVPASSLPKLIQAFKDELALELSGRGDPNRIITAEHEMTLKGGKLVWAEARIKFLHNEQGQPIGILGVTRDITERRRAEQALRESEAKFRALAEDTHDIVYAADAAGNITYMGPQVARYDMDSEGLIGKNILEFIYPDDRERIISDFQRTMTTGDEFPSEFRVVDARGNAHWLEEMGRVQRDESGIVTGLTGVLRDITERKRAEEALRKADKRYQCFTSNPLNCVFVADEQGIITEANEATMKFLDLSQDDLGAVNILSFVHPEDLSMAAAAMTQAIAKGHGDPLQARLISKSGRRAWVEIYSSELEVQGDHRLGMGIFHDITDRRQAAEALRQSEEKLKDLVEKLRLSQEALSTPVVQMWDKVLALPLIGVIDDQRAQRIMEVVLRKIVETQSEVLIMDVTGVASMDTTVTNHLLRTIQSASMLGAQCILTGIRPEVAHAVTNLGMDMSKVIVKRDLQDGLRWALHNLGYGIQAR